MADEPTIDGCIPAERASLASPRRMRIVMALVTGAMFMEILDGTVIVTALPAMAQTFGTSPLALNVGISAYLLALGVAIPASGWVADRYGARRVFAAALVLFTLASAACGSAGGAPAFIAFRIVQGIAGAMMVPVGRLIVMHFTPRDQLMAALSALVWPALIAPVLGPPLGGLITEQFGWRWIFYLNVPLGIAAFVAALMFVPDARDETRRRFDWIGFLLAGTGTFALLVGLERLGTDVDAANVLLLAAGVALLAVTVRHLERTPMPLIDLGAYAVPTFRASMRGGSFMRLAIGAAPFLLPLMFQVGFGYDAFHAGLLVLALFAGNLVMKAGTTPVLRRWGFRRVLIGNGILAAASLAACALIARDTPTAITVAVLFVGGLTRSMQFTTLSTLAFADVSRKQMSDANGLFGTISQVCAAGSVAIAALAVRGAEPLAAAIGFDAAGAAYRIAFLGLALIALAGLVDGIRLPQDAGDSFVRRPASDSPEP